MIIEERETNLTGSELEGDVRVTRDLLVDSSADIRRDVNVGGSLKIGGWLEAPNIKGIIKGAYPTAARLRQVYPAPEEGWVAFVGEQTWKLWRADLNSESRRVAWTETEVTVDLHIDSEALVAAETTLNTLATWKAGLGSVVKDATVNRQLTGVTLNLTTVDLKTGTTGNMSVELPEASMMLPGILSKQQSYDLFILETLLDPSVSHDNKKFALLNHDGKLPQASLPDHVAMTDENGKMPRESLPKHIVQFAGIVDVPAPTSDLRESERAELVWNTRTHSFVWSKILESLVRTEYFANWEGHDNPEVNTDILYVHLGRGVVYIYDGTDMVPLDLPEYEARIEDLENSSTFQTLSDLIDPTYDYSGCKLAILDPDRKIPSGDMPSRIVWFDGVVSVEPPENDLSGGMAQLVWNSRELGFIWQKLSGSLALNEYYANWDGHDKPRIGSDILYVHRRRGLAYVFDHEDLVPLGNADLEARVEELEERLAALENNA